MLNKKGDALYVGKAKSLKRRVTSYTNPQRQTIRILRMISQTASMEFIETHTEAEALLLEANLIKKLKPRYNILLRDDKSFPFIRITATHDFPRVLKHRGAQPKEDEFFGPFASAWAVNQTLDILQQAFCCAPARILFSPGGRGPASSTRSNDAAPLVSKARYPRTTTGLWSIRHGTFYAARA